MRTRSTETKNTPPLRRKNNIVLKSSSKKPSLLEQMSKWLSPRQPQLTELSETETAEDLVCPLTLELPVDPVRAQDGYIYERAAIENYFEGKSRSEIRSPVTKERMSKRLSSVPQFKSLIETAIELSVVSRDMAQKWKEREQQKKTMAKALKQAEHGKASAMEYLVACYSNGWNGVPQDKSVAYRWARLASASGSIRATALVGEMLLYGEGVEKDIKRGVEYLGRAAGKGSDFAAHVLVEALDSGALPVDKAQTLVKVKL